jgi:hypothetical protein
MIIMFQTNKRLGKGCLWSAVLLLLLPLLFLIQPLYHNWNLRRLSRSLSTLQHSANTKHVKTLEYVGGNVMGTGNQIDYLVAEVRTYSTSKNSIRAFYSNRAIWNPIAGRSEKPVIVFADDTNDEAQTLMWMQDINSWQLFPPKTPKSYVVYVHDGGYASGFDLRGY